jgi:hypothetical protein
VDRAGRPPAGYFTKRTAEPWLREILDQARRGTLTGQVQAVVTFADAAAEWLRFIEEDRERKPSTLKDYRSECMSGWLDVRRGAGITRRSRRGAVGLDGRNALGTLNRGGAYARWSGRGHPSHHFYFATPIARSAASSSWKRSLTRCWLSV